MKKTILTCLLLGATSFAFANDAAKVNLVKKMYRELQSSDTNGVEIIKKYADASLKRAMNRSEKDAEVKGQVPDCMGYDWMWHSQGDLPSSKVAVSMAANGRVKASFKMVGKRENVYYTLSCQGNTCKVTDVDNNRKCLKQFF